MSIIDEKTKRFAVNGMFPSFFYASLGLVFIQVGATQMHWAWSIGIFLSIPGLALAGLTLLRARRHWFPASEGMPSFQVPELGWYVLLLGLGVCIGVLARAGSAMLLGMVAALTYYLPWAKIPVCRAHFIVSSGVTVFGALAGAAIWRGPASPFHFMTAAWMLYFPGIFMHLLVIVSLDRGYRIREPDLINQPDVDPSAPILR